MKSFKCSDCTIKVDSKSPHPCKDGKFRCKKCQSPDLLHKKRVSSEAYRLKKRGITREEYTTQLQTQDNRCGVCLTSFKEGSKRNLDHSHKHGYNRKILCNNCNLLLGHAKENPQTLLAAISYLYSYERPDWDTFFMIMAQAISLRSQDPSTKLGAVIVGEGNRVVSMGYNGFPVRVRDTPERYNDRETKYSLIIHAEANAILFANNSQKCTMYTWPIPPCSRCAGLIINSGIKRVVSPKLPPSHRWSDSISLTKVMFQESGVSFIEL